MLGLEGDLDLRGREYFWDLYFTYGCDLFTRDAAGQISSIETGFLNLAVVEFAGLQSSLSWATGLGDYGDLDLSLNHLYTDKQHETPGSGNTVRLEGTIGRSKHRVTATAGWSLGDWTVFNQFRWLDGAVFSNADDEFSRTVPGVGSWFVMDTSIRYALNDNIDFQLNIDNLLDREMPFPAAASGCRPFPHGHLTGFRATRAGWYKSVSELSILVATGGSNRS